MDTDIDTTPEVNSPPSPNLGPWAAPSPAKKQAPPKKPAPSKPAPKPAAKPKKKPKKKKAMSSEAATVELIEKLTEHPEKIPPLLPKTDRLAAARASLAVKRSLAKPLHKDIRAAITKANKPKTIWKKTEPYNPAQSNGVDHDPPAPKIGRPKRVHVDPLRVALAAVNERVDKAAAEIRRQNNGLALLQQRTREAEVEIEKRKKAVVTAQEAYQSALADAAAANQPEPQSSVPAAEAALATAQARLNGLKGARRLNEEGNGAVYDKNRAEREQHDLIKPIVFEDRDALLRRAEQMWKTFAPCIHALQAYVDSDKVFDNDLVHDQIEGRRSVRDFLTRVHAHTGLHPNSWDGYVEMLKRDAKSGPPPAIADVLKGMEPPED